MAYQIGPNCVCCHYCRMECPVSAITYKGTRYAIDPEKCISCGLCQTLCHVNAITGTEDTGTIPSHDLKTMSCDVVVVGSGRLRCHCGHQACRRR